MFLQTNGALPPKYAKCSCCLCMYICACMQWKQWNNKFFFQIAGFCGRLVKRHRDGEGWQRMRQKLTTVQWQQPPVGRRHVMNTMPLSGSTNMNANAKEFWESALVDFVQHGKTAKTTRQVKQARQCALSCLSHLSCHLHCFTLMNANAKCRIFLSCVKKSTKKISMSDFYERGGSPTTRGVAGATVTIFGLLQRQGPACSCSSWCAAAAPVQSHHSPHPSTPRPLIMVVCESAPTRLSGYSQPLLWNTTRPRNSRFTWCTIPEPGGTMRMFCSAWDPHWVEREIANADTGYNHLCQQEKQAVSCQ